MRLYKYFGTSFYNGEIKVRASASENYGNLMHSLGHSNIKVVDVTEDGTVLLSKLEGARVLVAHPSFQDAESQEVIAAYIAQHTPKPKGKPGRPRKIAVAEVPVAESPVVQEFNDPLVAAAAMLAAKEREKAIEDALEAA